ncbi:GatB/YqeY domain-containing protein [Saccharothrix obliqua]|uniref:GatB/YqeY domain-containing protein n=1 Tax=Saccharothrix obliqua TaxID=2861747 RepID=UPI001C60126C|nr:GatB/YqeY domain-containing protein [Saccharothrix obliqua]MBW4716763.1 GatB/YqeY domain-containing protein [Saccharothrix obliqua]
MRTDLRRELTRAIKGKDRIAVSALRSALAAIENSEAVPDDSPASGSVGVGSTEVERRQLTDEDVHAIVTAEVRQRITAAEEYDRLARADVAERLRAEADVLRRHLER